tara:strand:+ start:3916 stop:4257 length:342 start_codon:yes stop_codon:yes gene_type:complete
MPSNSETLLTTQTHPADSTVQTVTGTEVKGDGYYGRSDGIHTVQYSFTDLQGTITIQGTLATTPTATDWFDVQTYIETSASGTKVANFTGNYVWIRAKLVYTAGSVSSVVLNH